MKPEILHSDNGYELNNIVVSGLSHSRSLALLLRANGFTYKSCAQIMGCSADNVKNRIEDLYYELRVNSTPQLITKSIQSGYMRLLTVAFAMLLSLAHPTDKNTHQRISRLHRINTYRVMREA